MMRRLTLRTAREYGPSIEPCRSRCHLCSQSRRPDATHRPYSTSWRFNTPDALRAIRTSTWPTQGTRTSVTDWYHRSVVTQTPAVASDGQDVSDPPRVPKPRVGAVLRDDSQIYQVYGANTGVGKTIISTALLGYHASRGHDTLYIKPVSTGAEDEADVNHLSVFSPTTTVKGLLTFDIPTSPHLAAVGSKVADATDDGRLLSRLHGDLSGPLAAGSLAIVEGAGGIMSPGPSGKPQADLYRPLRLPVILVADHRLGGISSTISAFESLHLRGYDIDAIVIFSDMIHDNFSYLQRYFKDQTSVISLAAPPPKQDDAGLDRYAMQRYYRHIHGQTGMQILHETLQERHETRRRELRGLAEKTVDKIWHPFMQHTERTVDDLMIIDSAHGDEFQIFQRGTPQGTNALATVFDGSASWWTQGLGHGNPQLALTAAHAAGRYGHVMFANAAHAPAVRLACQLIDGHDQVGERVRHKYSKCFYSDNGSTGMEVAVKMALRAAALRYGWSPSDKIQVLGLKGSYHGDTIGVMDCSEENVYNEKVEWYRPRGQWLDFPQIKMKDGKWKIIPPTGAEDIYGPVEEYDSIDAVFDLTSRAGAGEKYAKALDKTLQEMIAAGVKLGALIMEPVILGAGGMLFADPLFQHELVKATQRLVQDGSTDVRVADLADVDGNTTAPHDDWSGMPVVADEVFTGLYRLNRMRSSDLIAIRPDIVVNAKLLTGGLLPLATTMASESIFEAFLGDSKADALLHGHSYTAHAVGCEVALQSLQTLEKLSVDQQASIDALRRCDVPVSANASTYTIWSLRMLDELSRQASVESVVALGTVLTIECKDPTGAGYTSTAASGFRDALFQHTNADILRAHCRVLGNVLYFMAAPSTTREVTAEVERAILKAFGPGR